MKNQCDLDDAKSLLLNDAEIRVVPRFSADPLLAELDRRHVLADEPEVQAEERRQQDGQETWRRARVSLLLNTWRTSGHRSALATTVEIPKCTRDKRRNIKVYLRQKPQYYSTLSTNVAIF